MNAFQQLGRQLLAIWKQLGLNQRISIVLAAAAVMGVLAALALWSSRVDYGLLYGKLDEAEAARVVSYLDEAKIPYRVGGGTIHVPRDKVHVARMQLASRGIPRGDGVGFEIFDKPNFGISDFVQRANYLRALQGELARTISQLDEVEAARVMIVIPENRLLVDNNKKPTASVFVRVKGHGSLPPSAIQSIRFLVANAVEGLQAGSVTVVDNRGNVLSENHDADSIAGLTASQLAARRGLEQYLAKKAEGMLEAVLGPGQAVVRVAAEVNTDVLTRTDEKFDPEGQIARSNTITDENTETTSASPTAGGIPGVAVNIGAETNATSGAIGNSTHTKKKVSNIQYEINRTSSSLTQIAGGVKRLTAAVFVAARFEGAGKARKAVPRSTEELEKLRRIVQSALGLQMADTTRKDEITLEEMSFNDQVSEVVGDLGKQATRQFWFTQVQNFIYPALALGIFGYFAWSLKRTSRDRLAGRTEAETDLEAEAQLATPGRMGSGVPRTSERMAALASRGGGVGPRGPGEESEGLDEINRLLRDNPANVSQAIQQWLSRETTKSS
jgi:flagellar M-ring protein FliF